MKKLVQYHIRIRMAFLTVMLIFLSGTLTAMEKPAWENWKYPSKTVRGGEYRIAATMDVGLLNPHHWPVMNWDLIDYFFESYLVNGERAMTTPWTAESYEYRDASTFVLTLKKGIQFHDGSLLNAEAAKYNLNWIMDKKNGCWDRSYLQAIKSIELVDDHTIVLKLKEPYAIMHSQLQTIPGYAISVHSLKVDEAIREMEKLERKLKTAQRKLAKEEKKEKKATKKGEAAVNEAREKVYKAKKLVAKLKKQLSKAQKAVGNGRKTDVYPVGTGAFMYDSRSTGNWIRVKRNPNWWYGKSVGRPDAPYFDFVRVDTIPDTSIQLANLRVGKIHQMTLNPGQYVMLKSRKDPTIQIDTIARPHSEFIQFNHAKGPCKDIRVRKAISHAIDRKALLAGTRFGLGTVASCIFPDTNWAHNPNLKPVEYNPELSRQLLREAGCGDGLSIRGNALNTPEYTTIATAVKSMLKKVGIEWKYDMLAPVANTDRRANLEYDITLRQWPWIYHPDFSASGLYYPPAGINADRSNNPKAVELIAAGKKEFEFEKVRQIYHELETVLYENYEDAWLWWPREARAFHSTVRGYDAKMKEKFTVVWSVSHGAGGLWFEK